MLKEQEIKSKKAQVLQLYYKKGIKKTQTIDKQRFAF